MLAWTGDRSNPDPRLEPAAVGPPPFSANTTAAAAVAAVLLPTVTVAVASAATAVLSRRSPAAVTAVVRAAAFRAAGVGRPEAVLVALAPPLLPLLTPGGLPPSAACAHCVAVSSSSGSRPAAAAT